VAEGDGLLNRCTALKPYRGFESLRLRFSFVDFQRFTNFVFENLKDLKLFFTKLGSDEAKKSQFLEPHSPNFDPHKIVERVSRKSEPTLLELA
jgi:hypothetical protein